MAAAETKIELAGQSVVLTYSNVAAEYEALRRRAIVVNRSHRGRMRFAGAKAADVLTGLVTNDVGTILPGQGLYAAALSAKGKIVSDLRILRTETDFITDASPRSRDGWSGIVRKYVNPRLAKYSDESAVLSSLGVYGVQARHVVEQMTGIGASALAIMPAYTHVSLTRDSATIIVMHSPDLELEGFDLFVPAASFGALWSAAMHAHATPAGVGAWDIARIEAGRPEWGVDMDDSTMPQEANLDTLNAISYTKGCYTGQEVVARVHFRGHVNRMLRGLKFTGALPPVKAALFDSSSKQVGEITSGVASPRLGAIGLGMVRRETEIGATLKARWAAGASGDQSAGEAQAEVVALPFADK
ncbi:MAG: glycine cleavage T C-terminal barrel domain-containing protein [Gemmatimonadota bacterium]